MITRQELKDGDPVQRMAFCNQLVSTVEQNPQFLDQFIVSNEAVFSLNLEVNTRNVLRYSPHGQCCRAKFTRGGALLTSIKP